MDRTEMLRLIEQHIAAEIAGDTDGAVGVYAEGVLHDVVGSPAGPSTGVAGARGFYDDLMANLRTDAMDLTQSWLATTTVHGVFLGVPGNGRQISFRLLHIWEFSGGRISRENIWMDSGAVIGQLTS